MEGFVTDYISTYTGEVGRQPIYEDLGKAIGPGLVEHAKQSGLPVPAELTDPNKPPTPQQLVDFVFGIAAKYFPRLVPDESKGPQSY